VKKAKPQGALQHQKRVVRRCGEELVLEDSVQMEFACALEVFSKRLRDRIHQASALDHLHLVLGCGLGRQGRSETDRVEDQREGIGRPKSREH
jgi:hypothetical protein